MIKTANRNPDIEKKSINFMRYFILLIRTQQKKKNTGTRMLQTKPDTQPMNKEKDIIIF